MKNSNPKKYKIIIIVILLIIPIFIFRQNIILFVTNIVGQGERLLKTSSNKTTILQEEEASIVKVAPETPGALKLINKLINVNETDLTKDQIIIETNIVRVKNKLSNLTENKLLNLSAEKKLKDILEKQYFEHVSPDGVGIDNLSDEVGYEYILIGENLAMGSFKNDKDLVDAWMGSFGHRKNILKSSYAEIGVAVARGVFNGENVWVAVQHFGTPKSLCPKINISLHEVVKFNQEQINNLEEDLRMRLVRINTSRGYSSSKNKAEEAKKVEEYNNLVNYYNSLVDQVEKDTITYNNQVKSFNDCVAKYQE
jgi:uncharacterized protein YkwD